MAAFVNAFKIAVDAQVTRIEIQDVNVTEQRETTIADLALTNESALGLAHKIIEMHGEHTAKMIEAAKGQANGATAESGAAGVETVN